MAADNTLRYISYDYQSHKNALIDRVKSRWPGVWTDFMTSSFGILLIDIVAWSTATLAFLVNRLAAENYIPTMTLLESARRIGALTNYKLRGTVAASVACEVKLTSAATADATIAKGTQVRIGEMPFEVSQDYTILSGARFPELKILRLGASLTGPKTISSNVTVTDGSPYVDVVVPVELTEHAQVGQSFRALPQVAGVEQIYTITAISAAPGSSVNNRLTIDPVWAGKVEGELTVEGVQSEVSAEVYDRRITLTQGQSVSDQFVTPSVSTPSYVVRLSRTPLIDGTLSVTVDSVVWSQVDSLAVQDSQSKVFQLKTLSDGTPLLQFGDGSFGALVPQNAVVEVDYRVGGGAVGNVPIGAVNVSVTASSNAGIIPVPLVNLTSPGEGGMDAETLEEARVNIPYWTRMNDRAVTLEDYQTFASIFRSARHGAISYARAAVRPEALESNTVVVYAWAPGPAGGLVSLSSEFKLELQQYLQTKAVATDYVLVADGNDRPVPLSLRFKAFSGFDITAVETEVGLQVRSFIANLRPGSTVVYSDLLRKIDEVSGVDSVTMATPISDLATSTPMELFTPPDEEYSFVLERLAGSLLNEYTCQLPASPLAAWSFRAFLDGSELLVTPDSQPGYARLLGSPLLDTPKSVVNLLTGQARFFTESSGDFEVKLIPVKGYDQERVVNVYAGYTGDSSQAKRREIRAALRAWADNLSVGAPVYAGDSTRAATGYDTDGILASKSNVSAVVAAISGVTAVSRVALDTPANTDLRLTVPDYSLVKLGLISLNNYAD